MKILRMGYVFNALWSIKIWLPPRAPLSPLSVGPVPKNRPSPRTSGWELESQIRRPSPTSRPWPGVSETKYPSRCVGRHGTAKLRAVRPDRAHEAAA